MTSQRDRAAAAATAAERLAASLANGVDDDDPITVAYLLRLQEAVARVEDYAQHALRNVRPDQAYMGRIATDMRTTASLYGNNRG